MLINTKADLAAEDESGHNFTMACGAAQIVRQ